MINRIIIENYRSARKVAFDLGRLNLVFGANGAGKSNIYNALRLIQGAADGRISAQLAGEGGIQRAMWAGDTKTSELRRMTLSVDTDAFSYEMQIGYPDKIPYPTFFKLDPVIKEESLWLAGFGRRPSSLVMKRRNQTVFLTNVEGEKVSYAASLYENESVFGQIGEPHRYPEVSSAREFIRNWRFYHEFNVSGGSPLRAPQVGYRSPVLAGDGLNLAAAFRTIEEVGDGDLLHEVLDSAFPQCAFQVALVDGRFQMQMIRQGLRRPLDAAEMSGGTLRFLCLAVALLSPRPPAFIALNEPENSLHQDMLPALAKLIAEASRYTQIWLTSHSMALATLIKAHAAFSLFELSIEDGASSLAQIG